MPSRKGSYRGGGGGLEKSSSHMTQTLLLELTLTHTKGTAVLQTRKPIILLHQCTERECHSDKRLNSIHNTKNEGQ